MMYTKLLVSKMSWAIDWPSHTKLLSIWTAAYLMKYAVKYKIYNKYGRLYKEHKVFQLIVLVSWTW